MNPIAQSYETEECSKISRNLVIPRVTDFDFKVLSILNKNKKATVGMICRELNLSSDDASPFVSMILKRFMKIKIISKEMIVENGHIKPQYSFNKQAGYRAKEIKLSGKGIMISNPESNIGIMAFDLTALKKH